MPFAFHHSRAANAIGPKEINHEDTKHTKAGTKTSLKRSPIGITNKARNSDHPVAVPKRMTWPVSAQYHLDRVRLRHRT